jgi:hypothetical protein
VLGSQNEILKCENRTDMKLRLFKIILVAAFALVPALSFGQDTIVSKKKSGEEKKVSYSFINEYGFSIGASFNNGGLYGDLSGIFVNSISFNKKQDMIGIGVGVDFFDVVVVVSFPIFVNYRHYFPSKTNIKPLINVAIGTQINTWGEADLYSTIAGGFKVKAFSFTAGVCVKSWGINFFGGGEIKMGYTFLK